MRTALDAIALVLAVTGLVTGQKPPLAVKSPVQDIRIECNSNDIVVSIFTITDFNGMVYPKGLSKNSTCMSEFIRQESPVQYKLSLRNCNTMGVLQEDGIEYFNTIVVQPHRRLVTNQGRGYHIRCKYQTRDKAINNTLAVSQLGTTPLTATAPMPVCSMKIYSDVADKAIAETVKIGDPLTLEVSIDEQDIYGLKVVDCMVRDGLGWGQQPLVNSEGCPVDFEILGPLEYTDSKTSASVSFLAHKFPYTASVYYQCNVRLCLKHGGGCDDVPPVCEQGKNLRRRRRALQNATVTDVEPGDERVIEVFSGLYVNEGSEPEAAESGDGPTKEELEDGDILCISPRTFAIAIAIVGLLLMIAAVVAIMVIISRRRRRKDMSATGSSIYSGPYTNTAYSHSS
ncbi:cuticlin-1-like isoform X2 [Pollicipes pollicipes]|uniref:cuticlin-1-like isoform X1 n=1 Tax=Pollicipes pollicipes TaxID=41117 RepID=UPI0018858938|nr:cuticlin-1-like isoform X1 [Pollicipes pollicipes]XP_037067908.1 cuticlin-1-like isoform X2 [Pollicipes pollicipes]